MCKPPKQAQSSRSKPSLAFPIRCDGCGYYFRTPGHLSMHRNGAPYVMARLHDEDGWL